MKYYLYLCREKISYMHVYFEDEINKENFNRDETI